MTVMQNKNSGKILYLFINCVQIKYVNTIKYFIKRNKKEIEKKIRAMFTSKFRNSEILKILNCLTRLLLD